MSKNKLVILRGGTGDVTQAVAATAVNRVFVSGGTNKTRVETPVTIDPSTGDMAGIGEIAATSASVAAIQLSTAPAADDTYKGFALTGRNAGATIAQWEAVYLSSSSTWLLADANGTGTYPARGLAVAAYVNTNAAIILVQGIVRNDAWAWTPGGDIYLSGTAGALTQTAPAVAGDKVQPVGYAVTATIAYFHFNQAYVTVA